jgi:multidrug resistance efflux pump
MPKVLFFCMICAASYLQSSELPPPSIRFRVQTFARERAVIANPIAWVQLLDQVEEGTRVNQNDVVFTLDLEGTRNAISNLERRLKREDNLAAQDVANMESTLQGLRDSRETLTDNLKIYQARLNYLKSLPKSEDVSIARGRRNVARERLEAEQQNLATMKERLQQNLIAPLQVQQAEWATAIQKARTRYAEIMLEISQRPAREEEMQKVALQIENLTLEIDKLDKEIPTQEVILGIRQATRSRRVESIRAELSERKEELQYSTLQAPRDGVLLYTPQLKRQLTEGSKPSKGMVIGEIPEPGSLALAGVLPEQVRHLYQIGDPVEIRLNMMPERIVTGRLLSVSPFSRDALEEDEQSTGVKVVDVEVEMLDPPQDLPIGIYGWATMRSSSPLKGHPVPLSWVRYQGGKPHVSVNGVYTPVEGILQKDVFVLTPPYPQTTTLQEQGAWPSEAEEMPLETGNRFTVSGELLPLESEAVRAPQVRAWDMKISWLHPENQRVEAGELVARLDSEMIEDRLKTHIEDAERRTGDRESAEQELGMKRVERDFRLNSATNNLQIAALERTLVMEKDTDSSVARAEMEFTIAQIRLEMAEEDVKRARRTPELTAPAERERREREVERRKLALEKASIDLENAREGASDIEKDMASLRALRAEEALAREEARFQRDLSRLQSRLQWRMRRERRNERQLRQSREQEESMTLVAPVSGLVKYAKQWDGVRTSKVRTGMRVWPRNVLLTLSNANEVYVEVPLPERFVRRLEIGMQVQVVIPSEGNLQSVGTVTDVGRLLKPATPDTRPGSLYANQETTREQILPVRVVVDSGNGEALKPGAIAQLIFPFEK